MDVNPDLICDFGTPQSHYGTLQKWLRLKYQIRALLLYLISPDLLLPYLYSAKDETLMWIPIEGDIPLTNDSAVIFNHQHNGVLWSCQQHSACSDVPLRFPYAPEYYFLIEVSNR